MDEQIAPETPAKWLTKGTRGYAPRKPGEQPKGTRVFRDDRVVLLRKTRALKPWAPLLAWIRDGTKRKRRYWLSWNGYRLADNSEFRIMQEREPEALEAVIVFLQDQPFDRFNRKARDRRGSDE